MKLFAPSLDKVRERTNVLENGLLDQLDRLREKTRYRYDVTREGWTDDHLPILARPLATVDHSLHLISHYMLLQGQVRMVLACIHESYCPSRTFREYAHKLQGATRATLNRLEQDILKHLETVQMFYLEFDDPDRKPITSKQEWIRAETDERIQLARLKKAVLAARSIVAEIHTGCFLMEEMVKDLKFLVAKDQGGELLEMYD